MTVLIAVYNRPDYLKQSLQSVLDQTFTDYEIIVVDDCSPEDIISQYNLPDSVRLIRLPRNHGLAAPGRNVGIKEARGKYIAFLDADDVWLPEKLESAVRLLEANPDAGLVYSHMIITDDSLVPLQEQQKPQPVSDNPLRQIIINNFIGSPSYIMAPRDVLLEAGGFDEELPTSSDRDMWIKILKYRHPIFDPEPHVLYRKHQDQLSRDMIKRYTAHIKIFRNLLEWAGVERKDIIVLVRRRLCRTYVQLGKRCLSRGDSISDVLGILRQGFNVWPWSPVLYAMYIKTIVDYLINRMR
ncbi:MAG: glycosyltransferase family 2 protein [Armatimonadota bacterium]